MNNRIALFGASVTEQKNGYWRYFADLNQNFYVKNFGYGGTHLRDAGICYIDRVLEFRPEYCFIDWFSTGFIRDENFEQTKDFIDAIVYRFFSNGVKLIFLTFPDRGYLKEGIYRKINSYLGELGIPVIDLSLSFKNLDVILRDEIHTSEYGAEQYAKIITEMFLNGIFCSYELPEKYPPKNKYCDIKKIDLSATVFKRISFYGNCEVLGILQSVGPYTGMLSINGSQYINWDRWCHYEREKIDLRFLVNMGSVSIDVLNNDFDRSSCKYPCNWRVEKCLKLKTLYYIGEELKVLDYI
jgi:hypothetical protein